MTQEPYEVINHGLSFPPDLAEYERVNGTTHYDFREFLNKDGYGVKARPRPDWRERMEKEMREMGL